MCGIVGIWGSTEPGSMAAVGAQMRAMAHRGPDGHGALEYESGAAGMVRLALLDLSPRGDQPMWSPDRQVAILYNGEIYNFRTLRSQLEKSGYVFKSGTDTEVVLALYLERGLEFVDQLRGMYAIALFDWRGRRQGSQPALVLARDPFGIKPLYVSSPPGGPVVFASELRALLASGLVPREIDVDGLAEYLRQGFVQQPRTILSGVRMLEAGVLERYVPGEPRHRINFWRMPVHEPRSEEFGAAAERLRAALEESIALHAMADAPVGAFLSGGVDSSGIVGLMRRHNPKLRTYTLALPEFSQLDESANAIAASRALECEVTPVEVTGAQVAEMLPAFAASLDQPSVDGLNTWFISRAAARDVKGVLSGLGGDELFAGYPVTRRMARSRASMRGQAESLMGDLAGTLGRFVPDGALRRGMDRVAARRSLLSLWAQPHSVFPDRTVERLLGRPSAAADMNATMEAVLDAMFADWRAESPIGVSLLLDVSVYMRSQLLRDSDSTSMAHSLELRVPFVDREIAAFSRSCSDEFKLAHDGGNAQHYEASGAKRVLIAALRDVLPADIQNRPKRGFTLPLTEWLRGPLRPLAAEALESLPRRGLLDPAMLGEVARNEAELYPRRWALLILELWYRSVLA